MLRSKYVLQALWDLLGLHTAHNANIYSRGRMIVIASRTYEDLNPNLLLTSSFILHSDYQEAAFQYLTLLA
jgi:hypothetical protein